MFTGKTHDSASFIRERANLINRVQKVLESTNIKLASVATNVMGVSGRVMLEAIMRGNTHPEQMVYLAKGRMCEKREELARSLEGRIQAHHRLVLTELLCQIDSLDETIARFNQEIEDYYRPYEDMVVLLDTNPEIARETA